jgi:hypothetical protein
VTLGVQPGAGAEARATGVRVSAGTRRATGPSSVGHQGVTYRVDRAAPLFRIRYTLSHVVDRRSSTASTTVLASSFLAVRTPPRSGRTVVDVTGPGVRSTSCRAVLGPTDPRPCGERLGGTSDRTGRWHVELVGRELTDRVRVEVGAF